VALVPGGARNPLREDVLKRWPLPSYAALARKLSANNCSVVLVGGPQDAWVREGFAGLPGVTDAIGSTTVDNVLDLFAACDAVVTHDTGPMHLADLAGARLVALFGPTSPYEKGPLRPARILWGGEGLACRPCYDGVDYAPCRDNRCLQTLTPERVCDTVLELLRTKTPA
jgi:heptosyltransferase-2